MRGTRCVFNAAATLNSVFLSRAVERTTEPATHLARLLAPRLYSYSGSQARTYAQFVFRRVADRDPDAPPRGRFKLGRLPRDEEITHPLVQLASEDGKLSAPTPTRQILERLDRRRESLVVVAQPDPEKENSMQYPVCKVVNRAAERAAEKEKALAARKKNVLNKELELNWAIDPHDLGHRLDKLKTFLEKGCRVEITLMSRKRKRQATAEEGREVVRRVREVIGQVPGAKEYKPMEGAILASCKIFVEGPVGGKKGDARDAGD